MKVLIATEKPFAPVAVEGIKKEIENAGFELAILEKYTEKQQLLEAVADVNAIIIRSDKIDAEVLDAAKQLKIVVRAGAGYDNVDLEAATQHGVVVMNTPGQNSNAVAELDFGLLVFTVRNFYNGKAGTELMGKKLGILAFGNVGRNVARVAKGFGMEVSAYDAFCPAEAIEAAGVHAAASQDELFETCDIVSLHMPLLDSTRHLIDADALAKMKPTALLVNTARGGIVDTEALLKALAEKKLFGAALDTIEGEPIPPDHPAFALDNLILTPHAGGNTEDNNSNMATFIMDNIDAVEAGKGADPHSIVNAKFLR